MGKIHNNLNIDNLMRTDWINQFDEYQQQEILRGLKEDVDVSIYAKTDFNFAQMRQIRIGLERKLNVSLYAKPEISGKEMEEIQEKLWKESTH